MAKQDTFGTLLNVAALVMVGVAVFFALGNPNVPTAQAEVGGDVQRIFYFHVGIAWVAGLALLVSFVSSILYLWRGEQRKYDIIAAASVEVGVVFGLMTIASGMFWGRPTWNTWWTWDPRLTTTALTEFIYIAYLMLRGAVQDPARRGRFSAVYAIIGFASVPITYFATKWWDSIHPSGEVLSAGLTPAMRPAMFLALIAFTLVYLVLVRARMRVERMSDEVAWLKQEILSS